VNSAAAAPLTRPVATSSTIDKQQHQQRMGRGLPGDEWGEAGSRRSIGMHRESVNATCDRWEKN
jgi:hypothetical protein